jgi:hypothetical protein
MNIPVKQISYKIRIKVNGKVFILNKLYSEDYDDPELLKDNDPHIRAFNKEFYTSTNY